MGIPSDLRAQALDLPSPDREELAHELFRSIKPGGADRDPGYEAAWAAEIEERYRKFESGESRAVSADESIEQLRESLRRRRTP